MFSALLRPVLTCTLLLSPLSLLQADPAKVTVTQSGEKYQLEVNGKPYFIRGAGGARSLNMLREFGGNTVRTWGIDTLQESFDGKPLIQKAEETGIMIVAGIWLQHERHGFNYSDPKKIEEQREKVRKAVLQNKEQPAILLWGLGNEMEGPMGSGNDPRIWQEVNYLAGMVKELDPNHPVMTVIAGASDVKVRNALKYCPNVDILGVNAYAGAAGVGEAVQNAGWKRPFILTEFGPMGHWEVPKTPWGAPVEATSTEKAASYYATQSLLEEKSSNICLGSFAFLWGWKQEVTSTWYGMFLPDGSKLGAVDAMCFAWTKKWPANRCPSIRGVKAEFTQKEVQPGQTGSATVEAKDPEGTTLNYEWSVVSESKAASVGGDKEAAPPGHPECIVQQSNNEVAVRFPKQPGAYRLFLVVRDAAGSAATANIPFLVK